MFSAVSDVDVIADVDVTAAVAVARETTPHLVVIEPAVASLSGWEVVRRVCESRRTIRVVVFTRLEERCYADHAFRIGANGFVLKRSPFDELHRAIQTVCHGKNHVDAAMPAPGAALALHDARLSGREIAALRASMCGHRNAEIAAGMGIAIKTVEQHKRSAMKKLGLDTRVQAVRYAMVNGWLNDA